jgi:hypothetical protein
MSTQIYLVVHRTYAGNKLIATRCDTRRAAVKMIRDLQSRNVTVFGGPWEMPVSDEQGQLFIANRQIVAALTLAAKRHQRESKVPPDNA